MNRRAIEQAALSARILSIDAIERAKSGHPGLPLGCAELGALLFYEILKHNPCDPAWIDRDRFVLSAGHGSALLYSLLHLTGYGVSLEDIKSFRQVGSRTPGHPEHGVTPGVETTTGPLGQGFGNAVGMAIAEQMLAARFNTPAHSIIDHYTYVLAGDGDLMEGVASEAASLAGHLGLGKLIVFYDDNQVTIDGRTDLSFSEDVSLRFQAYHWQTLSGDAYDLEGILALVREAKQETGKPTLIRLRSVIGKGSPGLAGSHLAHGSVLGEEEMRRTKKALGVPEDEQFFVSPDAVRYTGEKMPAWTGAYQEWQRVFEEWRKENPRLHAQWKAFFEAHHKGGDTDIAFKTGERIATRIAGGRVLDRLLETHPDLVGGSADLSVPCFGSLKNIHSFQRDNPSGNYIYFGIREHAMGAICSGLALHGGIRAYCSTFLAFSDYMRPSIRLAALMRLPVIYILTHDSVLIGQDGPTHQPVEQLAALRCIPGLKVFRPADAEEIEAVWHIVLSEREGPAVITATRQEVEVFRKDDRQWRETIRRGAYTVRDCSGPPEVVIIATGSEVQTALEISEKLNGRRVRVVSMPCRELFLMQDRRFQRELLPDGAKKVVLELAVPQCWERVLEPDLPIFGLERFGISGPGPEVARTLQMDGDSLSVRIENLL
ncbi:MAG TPA: transketolase [Spirochaetia bacterium]|nr:transketolase [Spirochaetia bacterium]